MNNCKLAGPVAAAATALSRLGVRRGEQVLLMMPDGPGFINAFVAALELGAVPLPVNPALPARDVTAIAAEAGARLVVVSMERLRELAELEAEPSVLVEAPEGAWAAVLRLA